MSIRSKLLAVCFLLLPLAAQAQSIGGGIANVGGSGGGSSTITADATATSGITSGHLIGSSGNLVVDSGIAYSTLTGGPFLPLAGGTLTGNLTSTPASANTELLTLQLGTLTANTKAINITGTWNSSGTTFDAPLFMNITNTASNAASLLMDLQVGGASKFKVDVAGNITLTGALAVTGEVTGLYALFGNTSTGILIDSANTSVGLQLTPTQILTWTPTTVGQTSDLALYRDAANILAISNVGAGGTSPTALRIYNTSSSSNANYERGVFGWTDNSNVLTIGTQAGGTGTTRNLEFVVGGVNKLDYGITTTGIWSVSTSLAVAGGITIGLSNTVQWGSAGYIFGNATTGVNTGTMRIVPGSGNSALNFGGDTSSFPALVRSTTGLKVRLADNSADAPFEAASYNVGGTAGASCAAGTVISSITVVNGIVTAITGTGC